MKSFGKNVTNIKIIKTLSRPRAAGTPGDMMTGVRYGYDALDRAERIRALYAKGGRKMVVDTLLSEKASPHTRRDWTWHWASKIMRGYFCAPFYGEMVNEWGWKSTGIFAAMGDGSGVVLWRGVQHKV